MANYNNDSGNNGNIAEYDETELHDALKHVLEIVEMEQERSFVSNAELFDQLLAVYASQLSSNLTPTKVASDYTGVHLGHMYEDNDIKMLIKSFKNNQQLDAFYAFKIINDAKRMLINMPNIRECTLDENDRESGVIIVGDLHGNFNDLCHLIDKFDIPGRDWKFIFNGDYCDRGTKQIETILILLYAFIQRPMRVFLNRGNHEDISMNTCSHFDPNLLNDIRIKYGKFSAVIFDAITDLFRYLPLATIYHNKVTNQRAFVVHGGVSDQLDLNFIQNVAIRSKFKKLCIHPSESSSYTNNDIEASKQICDMLWSDPIRYENGQLKPNGAKKYQGCYFNQQRNLGKLFGENVTNAFCQKYNFDFLVRSHEVRDRGFSEDHQNCLTIFSASFYCNCDNMGAVIKIETNSTKLDIYKFKNYIGDVSNGLYQKNNLLIKQFKKLIQLSKKDLMIKFNSHDLQSTGYIDIDRWTKILSDHFNNQISMRHLFVIKDLLCECESKTHLCNYRSMFYPSNSRHLNGEPYNEFTRDYLDVIRNLFDLIDINHDKSISVNEAERALILVNQTFNKNNSGSNRPIQEQCLDFIKMLDCNRDNKIDLNEFYKAFFEENGDDSFDAINKTKNIPQKAQTITAIPIQKQLYHRPRSFTNENLDSDISEDEEAQIVRL
jgi:serine/threonine-protein phosphatase with EF-hands